MATEEKEFIKGRQVVNNKDNNKGIGKGDKPPFGEGIELSVPLFDPVNPTDLDEDEEEIIEENPPAPTITTITCLEQ
eukprot:7479283-Ditylum_brightwellii.AAC.1